MKQAQELQGRMADLQEQLAQLEITGAAGGGVVEVGRTAPRRLQ